MFRNEMCSISRQLIVMAVTVKRRRLLERRRSSIFVYISTLQIIRGVTLGVCRYLLSIAYRTLSMGDISYLRLYNGKEVGQIMDSFVTGDALLLSPGLPQRRIILSVASRVYTKVIKVTILRYTCVRRVR